MKAFRTIAVVLAMAVLAAVSCGGGASSARPSISDDVVRISYFNKKYIGASPNAPYSSSYVSLQTSGWMEKRTFKDHPLKDKALGLDNMVKDDVAEKLIEYATDTGIFALPAFRGKGFVKDDMYSRVLCVETAEKDFIVVYEDLKTPEQRRAFNDMGLAVIGAFQSAAEPVMIKMESTNDVWKRFLEDYKKEKQVPKDSK